MPKNESTGPVVTNLEEFNFQENIPKLSILSILTASYKKGFKLTSEKVRDHVKRRNYNFKPGIISIFIGICVLSCRFVTLGNHRILRSS